MVVIPAALPSPWKILTMPLSFFWTRTSLKNSTLWKTANLAQPSFGWHVRNLIASLVQQYCWWSQRNFSILFFFSPSATSKDDTEVHASASPDISGVLCCEVCGKYGLPQDFLASGRFCSLTCVGVYTGRRNKGREYARHAKTLDGKIVKRKKKDKGKKTVLPTKGADHVNIAYFFRSPSCF